MNDAIRQGGDAARPVDPAFIRRAIDGADLNSLRLAMLQLTGDSTLAAMKIDIRPLRGGARAGPFVAEEAIGTLKEKAFALLSGGALAAPPMQFSRTEVRRLMENFGGGRPLRDEEFPMSYEELALEPVPREVRWRNRPPQSVLDGYRVAVIGGGLSGVSMGAQLGRLGLPYTIVERLEGLGGTWLRNTYPDVRVDTDCYNYQFKFEKKYPWKEHYPSQREVLKYVTHIAEKYDIIRNVRFNTELERAVWDDEASKWRLRLRGADGSEETVEADVVVSAAGLFGQVNLPDFPGIGDYRGRIVHPAKWDAGYDFSGRNVALVGNGSTGVQLMPSIARVAGSLTVFQRTPQWIGAIDNYHRDFTPEERWLVDTMPFYWNWCSYAAYRSFTYLQYLQEHDADWKRKGGQVSESNDKLRRFLTDYIAGKLGDRADLIAKSTPTYPPLARRLVVDNGWYDALLRDNVELVTDGIDRFVEDGIVDGSGVKRAVDAVILGTGYAVARYLAPAQYVGRNGVTFDMAWQKDGPRSYLGLVMPGFPNFFMLYGPGSQARAGGLPSWIEIWTRYAAERIVGMLEGGARSIEVRQDVFDAYNASVDEAARSLLWETDGKGSYYLTAEGRSIVNQPWRSHEYHAAILASDLGDFIAR